MSDFEQKSKFPTLSFKGCLFLRNTHYDTDEEILLELYTVFTEISVYKINSAVCTKNPQTNALFQFIFWKQFLRELTL